MPPDDDGSLTPRQRKRLTRVRSDNAMIATLAATGLIAAFMQTVVTPIIPELPELLDTTRADASWVLTATLLAAAISTPISGRLGDMYSPSSTTGSPTPALATRSSSPARGSAARCR